MKVKVAETAGFCFGVKRAVDKVYELIESGVSPFTPLDRLSTMKRLFPTLKKRCGCCSGRGAL